MNRHLVLGLLVGGLMAGVLWARPGVVTLRDGQKIEGDITKDQPDQVTVNIRGIETNIGRDRIESVVYYDSLKEEVANRRAALGPQDAAGRIALARWAFDNRMYAEARDILDEVLETVDPNNREAAELRMVVRRQMQLEQRTNNPPPTDNGTAAEQPANNTGTTRPPAHSEENLLSPSQIMLIKIKEAKDRGERGLRLDVPNDVRREIVRALPGNITPRDFDNAAALEKLNAITTYGTKEDLERVTLQGDPQVMADFRQRVQPIILAGCATSGCHNTPEAGNFVLFDRAQSEAATYTNFLILQNYRQPRPDQAGVFGGELRMLDRQRPMDSLLATYMLPANQTNRPHPPAQGFRPMARDRGDQRYRDVVRWIDSLNKVDPNYDLNYTPPQKSAPATQPADSPAPAAR